MLLGNTGVGKSTLIAYLLQIKLIEVDIKLSTFEGYKRIIKKFNDEEFPSLKIGHEFKSETTCIRGFKSTEMKVMICDSPGFNDTKGVEVDIANSVGIN